MAEYSINQDVKDAIKNFLSPFVGLSNLIDEDRPLEEMEMNKVLSTLGKFPCYEVYELIDALRNGVTPIENAGEPKAV